MADSDNVPWLQQAAAQAVADSIGGTAFTVHRAAWAHVMPDLPPEVAAMVAPPISISSAAVGVLPSADEHRRAEQLRYRRNMATVPAGPGTNGRHRRSVPMS
jgi:hypothetical protein